MRKLIPLTLLLSLLLPVLVACGRSDDAGTPPPAEGGKRMSLEDAEKARPKTRGGKSED